MCLGIIDRNVLEIALDVKDIFDVAKKNVLFIASAIINTPKETPRQISVYVTTAI